jgi:hypothetical protein
LPSLSRNFTNGTRVRASPMLVLAERDASDCRAHSVNFRLQNTDPAMSNLLKRLGKLLPLGRNKPVGYDLDGTFLTGRRDMVP